MKVCLSLYMKVCLSCRRSSAKTRLSTVTTLRTSPQLLYLTLQTK